MCMLRRLINNDNSVKVQPKYTFSYCGTFVFGSDNISIIRGLFQEDPRDKGRWCICVFIMRRRNVKDGNNTQKSESIFIGPN